MLLMEVTCMCGFQARGTEDEVVEQIQTHGGAAHGSASCSSMRSDICRGS